MSRSHQPSAPVAWLLVLTVLSGAPALARRPPVHDARARPLVTERFGEFSYQFSQTEREDIASGTTTVSAIHRTSTPMMGWFPLRVSIDNTQGPRQSVTLTFAPIGTGAAIAHTVEVEAGERRAVSIPTPAELRYGSLEASSPVIGKQSSQLGFMPVWEPSRIILAFGTSQDFVRLTHLSADETNGNDRVLLMPLEEAPTELAAYVGFQAVAVGDERGLEPLTEAQRRALEAWVVSGGTLLVPSLPRAREVLPLVEGRDPVHRAGLGHVVELSGNTELGDAPVAHLPVAPLGRLSSKPLFSTRATAAAAALLPQARVPTGRFLFIITLFLALIGPGSVLLARRRGPAVLLASIPATAFITCLAILSSSILLDGFRVHNASWGYTLLDGPRHRAITIGVSGWYANLSPRSASFSRDTALIAPSRSGEATPVDLTWADDVRVGAGFLPARAYREWGLVSVSPTRARLVVTRVGERLALQNALGARVERVWVKLGDTLYVARNLGDGGQVELTPDHQESLALLHGAADDRFVNEHTAFFTQTPARDGEFVARLDGHGLLPLGGLSVDAAESGHVVRGEVEQ